MGLSKKRFLALGSENLQNNSFEYNLESIDLERFSFNKEQKFVSKILLLLKFCFLLLATTSLLKIGYISKIRVIRLGEIKESYLYEKEKYRELTNRFDDLFSLNGRQRFMKDQDQMISRDRMRVIWR